ncbi:hypothetical protein M427DRAFT_69784 [Gonapodya prolifera JEL478]|uniref:S-adenosyl-L-methionine-dependent methyltransferase n=1 Tax=Gonapodya prolifera (strain JEL478) TaxID=1344416 RepID=A0A139AGG7_GONPJ|nr:hypothetical protein M427DRAFT_69784 [Gonapodya prolifera JEL478]|eukprot:KXS15901.1 hypothetical protein M427DRAFT_69784 [Gonapodya prolifera JEL478]
MACSSFEVYSALVGASASLIVAAIRDRFSCSLSSNPNSTPPRDGPFAALDVGCGSGLVAERLILSGSLPRIGGVEPVVVGLDEDEDQLQEFRTRGRALQVKREIFRWASGDLIACRYRLDSESTTTSLQSSIRAALPSAYRGHPLQITPSSPGFFCDVIFSHLTFHHLPDLPHMIFLLSSLLRPPSETHPGGILIILDYEKSAHSRNFHWTPRLYGTVVAPDGSLDVDYQGGVKVAHPDGFGRQKLIDLLSQIFRDIHSHVVTEFAKIDEDGEERAYTLIAWVASGPRDSL